MSGANAHTIRTCVIALAIAFSLTSVPRASVADDPPASDAGAATGEEKLNVWQLRQRHSDKLISAINGVMKAAGCKPMGGGSRSCHAPDSCERAEAWLPRPFVHYEAAGNNEPCQFCTCRAQFWELASPEVAVETAKKLPQQRRAGDVTVYEGHFLTGDYSVPDLTGWQYYSKPLAQPLDGAGDPNFPTYMVAVIGGTYGNYLITVGITDSVTGARYDENLAALRKRVEATVAWLMKNLPGPLEKPEEKPDPFWEWYAEFSRLLQASRTTVDQAYTVAAAVGQRLPILRRSNRALLDFIYVDGTARTDPLSRRMAERAAEQSREIRDAVLQLEAATADAEKAYAFVDAALDAGHKQYSKEHGGLLLEWRRVYRDLAQRVPLDMALASGDPDAMRQAAEEAERQGLSARARLIQAALFRANGDVVAALFAIRQAAGDFPKDGEVKRRLAEAECAFLQVAIEKSQGAIQEARRAFYTYMMERGFAARDNAAGENTWHSMFTNPAQWDAETAWAVFTTGLFGSFSSYYDKPGAQADMLATDEGRLTVAYMGLHAMLRLRMRGHTLPEIRDMTTEQMQEWLPIKNLRGEAYTPTQAANLRVAIQQAMTLRDVQALVSGDRNDLELGVREAYWDPNDVGHTWVEYLGDITSAQNLLMIFLPWAKAGNVPGKIIWRAEELALVAAAQEAGTVFSGTEAVARMVYVDRALAAFGKAESGRSILSKLERMQQFERTFGDVGEQAPMLMRGIGVLNSVGWTVGKFTGTLILQGLAVHGADELAGHKGALAMQAALMFVGDSHMFIKLLRGAGIPPQQMERLLVTKLLPAAEDHVKATALVTRLSDDLEKFWAKQPATREGTVILTEEAFAELTRLKGPTWSLKQVPNGQPSNDIMLPLLESGTDAMKNVDGGASRAVKAIGPALADEAEHATRATSWIGRLAGDLRAADLPVEDIVMRPRPPIPVERAPPDWGAYPIPPAPRVGSRCAEAEAKLHAGDYKGAREQFERIRRMIVDGPPTEAQELPMDFLQLKIALAYELQFATKPPRLPLSDKDIVRAIAKEEVATVIAGRDNWRPIVKERSVSAGFYEVDVGDEAYFVKEVTREGRAGGLLEQAEGEIVHSDLARPLGLDAPGIDVHVVLRPGPNPGRVSAGGGGRGSTEILTGPDTGPPAVRADNVEKLFLISRRVEGKPLQELTAAEIFLFKQELARHRVLSILLGDYDRKLDNYFVSKKGRLTAIDAAWADVRGEVARLEGPPPNHPFYMEGANGRDHWLSRFFKDEAAAGSQNAQIADLWNPKTTFSRKGLVAEEALTYQDAKPVIDEVLKLVADEPKLRGILEGSFKKVYGNDVAKVQECVDQCVGTLQQRAKRLDEVMQGLDDRNLTRPAKPGAGTMLWPPRRLHEFAGRHVAPAGDGLPSARSDHALRAGPAWGHAGSKRMPEALAEAA